MVVVNTYSRGGSGGVGAIVNDQTGILDVGAGPGAVCSARGFNITRLGQKKVKEWVGKFLDDHLVVSLKVLLVLRVMDNSDGLFILRSDF